MTLFKKTSIETAFSRFAPATVTTAPPHTGSTVAPKEVETAAVGTPIDYGDPTICPYCKSVMETSKIRTLGGVLEQVFICRADRAVGCVPDAMLDTE
jgi:hypothetical protein